MSKSQPILYLSNHRKCLLNSIPFAQGLRIIRSCTSPIDVENELIDLMVKFKKRLYPDRVLLEALTKLNKINRDFLLTPRKPLLINNLRIHNPEILVKFGIDADNYAITQNISPENIYFVMPFYNCISNYSNLIKNTVINEMSKCTEVEMYTAINSCKITVSYTKVNCLKEKI